jgi:hypothetical protein
MKNQSREAVANHKGFINLESYLNNHSKKQNQSEQKSPYGRGTNNSSILERTIMAKNEANLLEFTQEEGNIRKMLAFEDEWSSFKDTMGSQKLA